MSTDLTVIVTAHDETAVCGPTMRAADLAVEAARGRGLTVQTVIGLDAPTEATSTYFRQPHFDHWERRVLHERELGRVRNALVPECDGRYIAFLDADDLFSENWLAEGVVALDAAAERGEHAIAHPELNVVFDGAKTMWLNIDQSSRLFTPHYLYFRHYYDSLCMAPREAHLEIPYVTRDVPNGLSYQDFQFTIESLAAGWRHVVVTDTIIFKRRRDVSLVTESNIRKSLVRALPAMAIDRVRDLGSTRR
ncbi:MAG TPA: glycosyltransferase family A protein [Nocardioidaceae bacterium]|nr:glycosyltransferase family A protein [Nocardioidaceae bacterium]